jgi:undecaprenyl-diphosphatase
MPVWLATLDHALHLWLARYHAPWLDSVMLTVTDLGARWFVWLVMAGIAFVFPARRADAWRLMLTIGFTYLLVDAGMKELVWRARPFEVFPDGYLIAARPTTSSFPSGHAASAFAGAVAASRLFPEARSIWFVLAALIAYSRLYIGVHFPLDVLVGAIVGILCALFVLGGRRGCRGRSVEARELPNLPSPPG